MEKSQVKEFVRFFLYCVGAAFAVVLVVGIFYAVQSEKLENKPETVGENVL